MVRLAGEFQEASGAFLKETISMHASDGLIVHQDAAIFAYNLR